MKQLFYYFLFLLILSSCNYRVYINGQFDHRDRGLTSNLKSTNDSCYIFENDDKLPDSVIYLNTIYVYSPFVWLTMHSPHYIMTNKARNEARTFGANIIQVVENGGTKFTRYRFKAKMYALRDPYLTEYKKLTDSMRIIKEKEDENFCIVHIKSFMYKWDNTPVYFNDSLINYCHGATSKKGGFNISQLDFKIPHEGVLSDRDNRMARQRHGINLMKGKEYFFNLIPCKSYGVCFVPVKKEEF